MAVQYKGGNQYLCNYLRSQAHAPVCQRLPADPVDQQVVAAFFDALAPAELDLYEQALAQRQQQQAALEQAQRYSLQRLEYEADQARRRYEQVDPAYRLVAAELERRWEAALQALQEAQEHYARLHQGPEADRAQPIPPALREAFSTLGQSLPTLWHQDTLSRAQRKALLRCLLEKVVLDRRAPDTITTRIVWRGGAVSELEVPCPVGTLRDLTGFAQMEAQVLRLESQGQSDEEIAQRLTLQGFRSPQLASRARQYGPNDSSAARASASLPGASSPARLRRFHGAADRCGTRGETPLGVPSDETCTRLQGEWSRVEKFSVKPGKVRVTTLKEARDGLDQDAKGRLA
jgi:hypothetical protein